MKRFLASLLPWLMLMSPSMAGNTTRPVLITGEVSVIDARPITTPNSMSNPITLKYFAPEGSFVKKGDLVLSIENTSSGQIDQLENTIQQTRYRADIDIARLRIAIVEAERNLATAKTQLAKTKIDAAIPKSQLPEMTWDKNRVEFEKAKHDLEVHTAALELARNAWARRIKDRDIEIENITKELEFARAEVAQSEVRASKDGYVFHQYSSFNGARIDQGSTSFSGEVAGQLIGNDDYILVAWVHEADRPFLPLDNKVNVRFTAFPLWSVNSQITRISEAPEERKQWGRGRYFRAEIPLPKEYSKDLLIGMSALIQPNWVKQAQSKPVAAPTTVDIKLDGIVKSHNTQTISPPSIRQLWRYNIGQIAAEGSLLKAGDRILTLRAEELSNRINTNKNLLNEQERQREKLTLDQQEATRNDQLGIEQVKSEAEKAARKATLPLELVPRVEYEKLVLDKALKSEYTAIAARKAQAESEKRSAEKRLNDTTIAQAQSKLQEAQVGAGKLNFKASFDGVVLYRRNFNNERPTVGMMVWQGQPLIDLADVSQAYISAWVPEANFTQIKLNQEISVFIPKLNQYVTARVSKIGRTVRSESEAKSTKVVDFELELTQKNKDILPDTKVQLVLNNKKSEANMQSKKQNATTSTSLNKASEGTKSTIKTAS